MKILAMDERVCEKCRYFYKHYIYVGKASGYLDIDHGYVPVNAGHCTKPRLKFKETFGTCEHFERAEEGVTG